jgi:hypothetical protein
MKTRMILSASVAILCAGALSSAQITPQGGAAQQRPPQPSTQQPRPGVSEAPETTLAGCLYREESIPGRSPSIAEKAGVGKDYILADAKTARETDGTPDRPTADSASRPSAGVAGLASGRMYKVTKLDSDRLMAFVGKRVEITGTIKSDNDVKPGEHPAGSQNLPNLEGTSIREAAGASCMPRPADESPATAAPSTPDPNR